MRQDVVDIRVRYNETDRMGIVHHSNYIYYYEMARTEFMRRLGVSYREMEESGVYLVVREVNSKYFAPAYYDEILHVTVKLVAEPMVKVTFDYEIHNDKGELLNTGRTVLASVDAKTRRPVRCPEWFIEMLK